MIDSPNPQLHAIEVAARYVINHIEAGHGLDDPKLVADLGTLRTDIDAALGPEQQPILNAIAMLGTSITVLGSDVNAGFSGVAEDIENGVATLATLTDDTDQVIREVAEQVAAIWRYVVPPQSAVLTYTFQGREFGRNIQSGRIPKVPVSIKDTDQGWSVAVGSLLDAEGEPVDISTVTIALSVDVPALVALVDNGGGAGTFGSAVVPGSGVTLPASTTLTAVVTNADGTAFDIADVITVVASDAVTGAFVFTAPA